MGGRRIMGAVSFVDSRWGVMLLSGKSEGTDMEEVCGGEKRGIHGKSLPFH